METAATADNKQNISILRAREGMNAEEEDVFIIFYPLTFEFHFHHFD